MKSIQVANTQAESISEEDIKNVLKNFSDNIYLKQNFILFIYDKNDIESYKKEVIERFISRMKRDYMIVYIPIILISIISLILCGLFFNLISSIKIENINITNSEYLKSYLLDFKPNSIIYTLFMFIFFILITICLIYLSYFLWNNTFTSNIRQGWSALFGINSYDKVCSILFIILMQSFGITYHIFDISSRWRSILTDAISTIEKIITLESEEIKEPYLKSEEIKEPYLESILFGQNKEKPIPEEKSISILKDRINLHTKNHIDHDIKETYSLLIILTIEIFVLILWIFVVLFYFIPNNCEHEDCDLQKVIETIKILKKEKELKEKTERLKKEKERLKKEKELKEKKEEKEEKEEER